MEPALKAARATLRIGTHDGVFHCDEVLACFMLRLLPKYKDAEIIRSRDDKVLDGCDIVVDVGGKYDHASHRYDHHQRGFMETASSITKIASTIKLSSAGLIYCHFGQEIIKTLAPETMTNEERDAVYNHVYKTLIQEVDAIDNGVPICEGEPRYKISTNLSSRVSYLNPAWNVPQDPKSMENFNKAMSLVGLEFLDRVNYVIHTWWPARKFVLEAINNRFEIHQSGRVMELKTFCPWKEHFFELAKELYLDVSMISFMIFVDTVGKWRVQGVPEDASSFVGKIFLHPDWRGLRDEELCKVSGIDGCTFVHASGFIGGNETREGAIEMAVKSIDHIQNTKE